MMEQWKDYFKPKKVLDLGCGIGLFGWSARAMNLDYTGLELSEYAVKVTRIKGVLLGDITEVQSFKNYDLVLKNFSNNGIYPFHKKHSFLGSKNLWFLR